MRYVADCPYAPWGGSPAPGPARVRPGSGRTAGENPMPAAFTQPAFIPAPAASTSARGPLPLVQRGRPPANAGIRWRHGTRLRQCRAASNQTLLSTRPGNASYGAQPLTEHANQSKTTEIPIPRRALLIHDPEHKNVPATKSQKISPSSRTLPKSYPKQSSQFTRNLRQAFQGLKSTYKTSRREPK